MTGSALPSFSAHPWKLDVHPPFVRAYCTRVVDGDTYDVFVDQLFGDRTERRIRLRGFDTPEIGGHAKTAVERARGEAAKARVVALIEGKPVMLRTYTDPQSFERWIADVLWFDAVGALHNLAETLRAEGFAK
jgi:endonuclease YncB( thermonuclease family)